MSDDSEHNELSSVSSNDTESNDGEGLPPRGGSSQREHSEASGSDEHSHEQSGNGEESGGESTATKSLPTAASPPAEFVTESTTTEFATFNNLYLVGRSNDNENSSAELSVPSNVHILMSRPESVLCTDPEWFQRQAIRLEQSSNGIEMAAVMDETFRAIDRGEKGLLDRQDVAFLLAVACERLNLPVDEGIIHAAVIALFEEAGCSLTPGDTSSVQHCLCGKSTIGNDSCFRMMTREEFHELFQKDTTRYRVFDCADDLTERRCRVSMRFDEDSSSTGSSNDDKSSSQVWEHAKTGWKNRRRSLVWLAIYCGTTAIVFCHKALQLYRTNDSPAIGPFLVLAKGSGAVLNLQGALILLPVTRRLTTWVLLACKWLRRLAPPNDAMYQAHAVIGAAMAFFAVTHTVGHLVQMYKVVNIDTPDDLEESVLDIIGTDFDSLPTSKAGRWAMMLQLRASWTGVVMLAIMIAAYLALPERRQRYNRFWYLHQLLILFLILQCIHGTGNLIARFQSLQWLAMPMSLYLAPRVYRELTCSKATIASTTLIQGSTDLVELTLEKPKAWDNNRLGAGMYVNVNIPSLARFEWHPFTLSSCPSDDYVQFHIQCVGDWTNKLSRAVQEFSTESLHEASTTGSLGEQIEIRLEGPFGTPAQEVRDYSVVVLIGAGVGVTVRADRASCFVIVCVLLSSHITTSRFHTHCSP